MIAAWMLYGCVVTLCLSGAAWAAERGCRLAGLPARFVWTGAIIAATLLSSGVAPVLGAGAATPPAAGIAGPGLALGPGPGHAVLARTLFIPAHSAVSVLDKPLLVVWGLGSLAWLTMLAISATRVLRSRPGWVEELVNGVPVLVSHDVGPAVVGVIHYSIVVPRWVLGAAAPSRDLILAHEREHVRAADPALLAVGAATILVLPWNAGLWYMMRRLRLVTEVDCDRRVLRARPDTRAYASLLLEVSERTIGGAVPVVALSEPARALKERLEDATARRPRHAALRFVAATCAAVLLAGLACAAPRPYSALSPGARVTALAGELAAVLESNSARARVSAAQLANVRETLGRVLDETDPYFRPGLQYLRTLAQRYYPEAVADRERPVAIALVFDARDSVVEHAIGVRLPGDRVCEDVVKRLLPDIAERTFSSGGCGDLDPGRSDRTVYWASFRRR